MLTFIQDGVPKLRAGDSDVKQPNLPNGASEQLMRSPWGFSRGVEQAMKSTCLEHEEVRRGRQGKARGGGVPLSPSKIQLARGTCKLQQACQTVVHGTTNSGASCQRDSEHSGWLQCLLMPHPGSGAGCQLTPHSKDLSAISQVGKGAKADAVKGRVAQCTHGWQEPKIENQSSGSSGRQT